MWVIKRVSDGKFVTLPGERDSYTRLLQRARVYPTLEAAQKDCCGNEYSVEVASCMRTPSK